MQRLAAIAMAHANFIDIARKVVEALGPQKIAVATRESVAATPELSRQFVIMRVLRLEHGMERAALGIKPLGDSDRFEKRRFSCAVFANEKRHPRMQLNRREVLNRRD